MRDLHARLRKDGFRPWLDEEDILGGTRWEDAIEDAVRDADVVIVCLSPGSTTKEGFLQREIRFALGVADEKPEDTIFIVPLKLEECEVPRRLKQWQWINYFQGDGYSRLFASLVKRAEQIGATVSAPMTPSVQEIRELKEKTPTTVFEKATEAAQFVLQKTNIRPQIGLILGSGLKDYARESADSMVVSYKEIPHFPASTVPGHAGEVVISEYRGVPLVAMTGRFHMYEGLKLEEVVFPVRFLARLGLRAILLTGAAGILNPEIPIGSLVVICDHLNLLGTNALIGMNDERFGPRFPDMTEVYSKHYRDLALQTANELGIRLFEGVYAVHSGPAYETPAEIRFMRNQGADLVGMSLVPEAIAARHMGLGVLAICAATSYAAEISTAPISHQEVLEATALFKKNFANLLDQTLPKIANELR